MRTLAILFCAAGLGIAAADDDAMKKDMKALEGEWAMVSATSNGEALPEEVVKVAKRSFKDGEATVTIDGEVRMKAKITLDPGKKPKSIDMEVTEGPQKGKKILGIYEIDGDKLKVCIAQPDAERPKDFTSKEGGKLTTSEWKREKK